MDANRHLRHSAYADIAAQARLEVLETIGLDMVAFAKLKMGPILFREELVYLKEIVGSQKVTVTSVLTKTARQGARWSIRHEFFREDGVKAAIINVDGAWMDLVVRKLGNLPPEYLAHFMEVPKSDDFIDEDIAGIG